MQPHDAARCATRIERAAPPGALTALAFFVVLAACTPQGDGPAARTAAPSTGEVAPVPTPAATPKADTSKETTMDDLKALVPAGFTVVDTVRGELTGSGARGAVLVVEEARSAPSRLGEGAKRRVLLIDVPAAGQARALASNDRIVPCATCGGLAGDPYGYARIEPGRVTIAIGGGSRERWSGEYTFVYEQAAARFVLERAVRRVVDTQTEREAAVDLDAAKLGVITFDAFDPAELGDEPVLEEEPAQG